jgi:outer membrane biosynthesis protein TonB
MAHNVSSPEVTPPHPAGVVRTRARGKPEVMIRVRVDSQGHAQAFRIMQGNQSRSSAALDAARHWSFQPCSRSAECEHLLKFTDYGDASSVQMIE